MGDKITRLYSEFEDAKRRGDLDTIRNISSESAMLSNSYKNNSPEYNACQDLCVEADEYLMDFENDENEKD